MKPHLPFLRHTASFSALLLVNPLPKAEADDIIFSDSSATGDGGFIRGTIIFTDNKGATACAKTC